MSASDPAAAQPGATLAISNHGLRNSGGIERYAMTIVRGLHARGIKPTVIAKAFDTTLPEYAWVTPVHTPVRAAPGKLRDLLFDWRIGRAKRRLGLYPLIGCNQTRWSDIGICGGTHPGFLEAMGQRAGVSDRWKIALLYPPIDRGKFCVIGAEPRAQLRAGFDFAPDRAVFLLASTGHSRKGLDLLAPFFAQTRLPVTLVIAGRKPDRPLPNVRYLGYRSDIENVYRAVDYTIVASHYEPFGLVGVESVLCGTPVLLAGNVGCGEVIREPGKIVFDRLVSASLEAAVAHAVARWQAATHRLERPDAQLAYDPSVEVHVAALLALVDAAIAARRAGAR